MYQLAWQEFRGSDVVPDEKVGQPTQANSQEELDAIRRDCLEFGFGGFAVKKGLAFFRPYGRDFILKHKTGTVWDRGSVLHVAPAIPEPEEGVRLVCGESAKWGLPEVLKTKSGYFASLFRHSWSDGKGCLHEFVDFPGGEQAFLVAAAWLAVDETTLVGAPWPLRDCSAVCDAIWSAAYLDAPRLFRSAVRSWSLSGQRMEKDLVNVAGVLAEASLQFAEVAQSVVMEEIRQLLQHVPRNKIELTSNLLVAPAAALQILETRQVARQTLADHIKTVGDWVGSVISGPADWGPDLENWPSGPHEFAVKLFEMHETFFSTQSQALRQLFNHIDASEPILPPLSFRLSSVALTAWAEDEEKSLDMYSRLWGNAVEIFERSLGTTTTPAEVAVHPACISGLFGVGNPAAGGNGIFGFDVLARSMVPPAAASVVLSRVLSSWSAEASGDSETDAADVILEGVVNDRQQLYTMLKRVWQRMVEDGKDLQLRSTDWGTLQDFAVPELQAALMRAIAGFTNASEDDWARSNSRIDEAVRLLFRVLFQATGGLNGVGFPIFFLRELRDQSRACTDLAARCAVSRLRETHALEKRQAWEIANELGPCIAWEEVQDSLIEIIVDMLREWLLSARRSCNEQDCVEAEMSVTRLLAELPLRRLQEPSRALGPPFPAHVLAGLAFRECSGQRCEIEFLRAEIARLSDEVERLSMRNPSG